MSQITTFLKTTLETNSKQSSKDASTDSAGSSTDGETPAFNKKRSNLKIMTPKNKPIQKAAKSVKVAAKKTSQKKVSSIKEESEDLDTMR